MSTTFTGKEILDLAIYAGFEVANPRDEDALEVEIIIADQSPVEVVVNENGNTGFFSKMALIDGLEENECIVLGDQIERPLLTFKEFIALGED